MVVPTSEAWRALFTDNEAVRSLVAQPSFVTRVLKDLGESLMICVGQTKVSLH